jgi:hypothetical protein
MKDPEEKEIMAYVAGLIDGDGHIGIRRRKEDDLHLPLIQLHNSARCILVYLNKLFGGTVVCDKPKKEHYRIVWKWMLQGKDVCRNFLQKVSPYLVLKQDSAFEMTEFLSNPVQGKDYYQSSKAMNFTRKTESYNFEGIARKTSQDPFFWAYLAGIMDTDGSFSIERSVRRAGENGQKNDLVKFRPKILLSLVTGNAIKYILSNCEYGNLHIVKAPTALRGEAFRFSIQSRSDAIEFLKKCIPYLQIKAIQAIKILNFCRNYNPTNGLARIPEEEKEYREKCYKEIVLLNSTPS